MQQRCHRNRKRSKRRSIYCLIDQHYLDSASAKYPLFADDSKQLQERGISRKNALLLMSNNHTVALDGEWIEAFWCLKCEKTRWYHVRKTGDRAYEVSIAPPELWQQVHGVLHPDGNPSVGEFTRRQSRLPGCNAFKDFKFVS